MKNKSLLILNSQAHKLTKILERELQIFYNEDDSRHSKRKNKKKQNKNKTKKKFMIKIKAVR